jgi:1-deoxy-D-xylulose 5-phosphate reductoisomerase
MVGLSAADELAVERFLRGEIPFTDIADLLRRGADLGARAKQSREPELDEIIAIDASVRASLTTPAAVA